MNLCSVIVCLIEDDEIMGEVLSDCLGFEGYICDWFIIGIVGEKVLVEKYYIVVICDI